jgi:hypothetical protein
MATYSIYVKGDDVAFVRDGFSWGSFAVAGVLLGFTHHVILAMVASILIGMFARDYKRWSLTQRGFAEADLMAANSLEEAELKYFSAPVARQSKILSHDTLGLFGSP